MTPTDRGVGETVQLSSSNFNVRKDQDVCPIRRNKDFVKAKWQCYRVLKYCEYMWDNIFCVYWGLTF